MFEKLKIKIQEYKLLGFVIVAGFVSVALFLLHAKPVSAAKVCDQATSNYCIEIIKIEPNSPEQSKDFTVSAALSTQNVTQSLRGKPINFAVRWKVNPSDIADFRDSLTNEVKISLTPDSSGNSSQNLTQVFNINKTGPSVIGIKLEVLNGTTSMGPQAFDSRQITVNPRAATNTDSVEISNVVSPSSSDTTGRLINFSANYFPAGASSPVTSGDFIIKWDFGDGTTTVGSTVSHLYDKAGTYNVTVKVQKNGQVIAQNSKSITVNGNPTEPGDMGNPVMTLINQIIGVLLGFLQELIYQVFFYLIAPLIQAVLSIQVYTDTFAAVIYPGWEVVRNICNIFFVVALIVIALATLFRVDSYQFRSLLVQLILAALLVNFSLVIAQAILGLADTIQAQFLPSNVEVIRSLAKDLMVKTYRDVYFTNAFSEGSFSGIVKPLFFLALAMGSFAVFAAIAVFLVIRVVMLWVLLLVSPMAYAVGVLPSTAGYRKQWWDMFLKYAFFTPIMAFFLNLTAVIANTYNTNPILQQINSPELQAQLGGSTIATFVFKVASNILLLVFLMAALKVADMAGVMGAGAITSVAQKGILAPFAGAAELGKRGAGYVSRKRDEISSHLVEGRKVGLGKKIAFTLINPGAVIKGYEKRSEELKHAAQGEAEAVGLMVVEQTMSKGKAFNRKAIAERAHDADFLKNYGDLTREEAINTAFDVATMANNMDGRAARRAIIEANMQEGWIDDIIMEAQENGQGKELIAKMKSLKSKQYRITDRDFEVSEVKDKEGNIIYEKKEDGSFKLDDKGNKIAKTKRNLKYNEKTRRALYLAMFGEHISKVVDKDGHEHEHVAIADQTAAKMIADGGEKYGRSTRHAEYMANQVYDTEANNKEGGYGFYDLEYATEIQDDDGTTHKVIDGYAVDGQYKGQLITKVNAGAVHARREVAKMGSREQAGIAHHALMDISNGKLDKEMFRVSSKALMDSPGFAQERTANYLMTGTDDIERLNEITKKYWETGTLDVDEASMQRIRDMYSVSPEATEIVLRKFLNKTNTEGVNEVRARGLKIKFKKPDGTVEEKNIIPDAPVKAKS